MSFTLSRIDSLESRCLFSINLSDPNAADYFSVKIDSATGQIGGLIQPGTYPAGDLLQLFGLDVGADVEFNGFDDLGLQSDWESAIASSGINAQITSFSSSAATLFVDDSSLQSDLTVQVNIADIRTLDVGITTSPNIGTAAGQVLYSGPVDDTTPAKPTIVNRRLTVNGTSGNDTITLSLKDGLARVNINGTVTKFNPTKFSRLTVDAGAGNDVVVIGAGFPAAAIYGREGNDQITAGDLADDLNGGPGADYILAGAGDDVVNGDAGRDTITGGAGKNKIYGGDDDDRLNGSNGRDFIYGGNGNDRIYGNGGDDQLFGEGNVDRIWGGSGNDLVSGGTSNDRLFGESGTDTLNGGTGTDTGNAVTGDSLISIEVTV